MKYFTFFSFLLSINFIYCQDTAKKNWILANTHSLDNISPSNENFDDLEFLIPILKDKHIVMLGEEDHTFASTFEAKTRLIKFLHQKLGFNIVAFEYDLYPIEKINSIKDSTNTLLPIQQVIYPFWGKSTSTQELFNYIEQSKSSSTPISYSGFDVQISPVFNLLNDLEAMLQSRKSEILSYRNYESFKAVFASHYPTQMSSVNFDEYALLVMFIDDILFEADIKKYDNHTEQVILRSLKNIKDDMLNHISGKPTMHYHLGNLNPPDSLHKYLGDIKSMGALNRRDKLMAENIVWLYEKLYPNQKIIVWAASEHTMYNRNKMSKSFPTDFPFHTRFTYGYNLKAMGSYLKDELGAKIYSIGFSTIKGTVDYSRNPSTKYLTPLFPAEGSIEEELAKLNLSTCFINLTNKKLPTFLFSDEMISNISGGNATTGNVAEFFDGILFIDNAKPIEYIDE